MGAHCAQVRADPLGEDRGTRGRGWLREVPAVVDQAKAQTRERMCGGLGGWEVGHLLRVEGVRGAVVSPEPVCCKQARADLSLGA